MPEKKFQNLDYHWHEALDRSFICMDMFERFIPEHPVVEQDKVLKTKAEQVHQFLL